MAARARKGRPKGYASWNPKPETLAVIVQSIRRMHV